MQHTMPFNCCKYFGLQKSITDCFDNDWVDKNSYDNDDGLDEDDNQDDDDNDVNCDWDNDGGDSDDDLGKNMNDVTPVFRLFPMDSK